ncbi:MAG TPA: L,D-transpeptidase [Ktedonobacteraceae bacterium]
MVSMAPYFFRGTTTLRLTYAVLVMVLLSTSLALNSCGSTNTAQQQAMQNQTRLEQLVHQARSSGIPSSSLQSILQQQRQLAATRPPLSLFSTQPVDEYYQGLATRYVQLRLQLQSIIATTTQREQNQAQHDLQMLQNLLAQQRTQGLPVQNFSLQFQQSQDAFLNARTFADFAHVSVQDAGIRQALNLLPEVSNQLKQLQTTITQMQSAHIDVGWLQSQDQSDQQLFKSASTMSDLQHVQELVNNQYQQAIVHSTLAVPVVTANKLQELAKKIAFLKTYGIDTTAYQQHFQAAQAQVSKVVTLRDYIAFSKLIDADIATMQNDTVQAQAHYLVNQFHQEVQNWGQAHLYHDSYDGNSYPLDAGYMQQGIGPDLDFALSQALTPADFQAVADMANDDLFNLHAFESDYVDKTAFNQVHKSDQQLLQRYGLLNRQVIVVSLARQAMRIYQNGKLIHGLQVTTGRPELPSLPGVWSVQGRLSPTTFTSPDPPGSPYWYPPTPIHYAILYHQGGYFVHDSWWRVDYGPGTQFPHVDSGGDQQFSYDGSHGCINVPLDEAGWIYNNTGWNTAIIIY